jgi:hypothetical protein
MDEYTIEDNGFTLSYFRNGFLHREDGPAIFWKEKMDEYFYFSPNISYNFKYKDLTVEQKKKAEALKEIADLNAVLYYLEGFKYDEIDYLNRDLNKTLPINEIKIKKIKI